MGMISDTIRGKDDTPRGHFQSLLTSFYLPDALLVASGLIFAVAAYTFVRDHRIFQHEMGERLEREA
uniref:MFS transporter n=1 Tax=Angiostrongylus cantonensis TaxID=6313 RepID=A0A0K0DGR4_ANGCA